MLLEQVVEGVTIKKSQVITKHSKRKTGYDRDDVHCSNYCKVSECPIGILGHYTTRLSCANFISKGSFS